MPIQGNDKLQLFEDRPIRTAWDEEQEEWYFSVVDVVSALTEQKTQRNASTYWAVLKKRLKDEGAEQLLTNCKQLKMKSPKDGKRYKTDVANTEQLLRIIRSIPSQRRAGHIKLGKAGKWYEGKLARRLGIRRILHTKSVKT